MRALATRAVALALALAVVAAEDCTRNCNGCKAGRCDVFGCSAGLYCCIDLGGDWYGACCTGCGVPSPSPAPSPSSLPSPSSPPQPSSACPPGRSGPGCAYDALACETCETNADNAVDGLLDYLTKAGTYRCEKTALKMMAECAELVAELSVWGTLGCLAYDALFFAACAAIQYELKAALHRMCVACPPESAATARYALSTSDMWQYPSFDLVAEVAVPGGECVSRCLNASTVTACRRPPVTCFRSSCTGFPVSGSSLQ